MTVTATMIVTATKEIGKHCEFFVCTINARACARFRNNRVE